MFIRVTVLSNSTSISHIWVNMDLIESFSLWGSGTRLYPTQGDKNYYVEESPEQIMKLITKGNRNAKTK